MHLPVCVYTNGRHSEYLLSAVARTTRQLDKLSAKVLEIWSKCTKCVLGDTNNDDALNKNVIFLLFCFPQVVQKQKFGEAGT